MHALSFPYLTKAIQHISAGIDSSMCRQRLRSALILHTERVEYPRLEGLSSPPHLPSLGLPGRVVHRLSVFNLRRCHCCLLALIPILVPTSVLSPLVYSCDETTRRVQKARHPTTHYQTHRDCHGVACGGHEDAIGQVGSLNAKVVTTGGISQRRPLVDSSCFLLLLQVETLHHVDQLRLPARMRVSK